MVIETLGEAYSLGVRITMRCAWGKRLGLKSIRECQYSKQLELESVICTRGATFPLSRLEGYLKCPRCGSRRVVLVYSFPSNGAAARMRAG